MSTIAVCLPLFLGFALLFAVANCSSASTSNAGRSFDAKKLEVSGDVVRDSPRAEEAQVLLNATRVQASETDEVSKVSRDDNQPSPAKAKHRGARKERRRKNRRKGKRGRKSQQQQDPEEILRKTIRHMFGFDHMITTPPMPVRYESATPAKNDAPRGSVEAGTGELDGSFPAEGQRRPAFPQVPEPPNFMLELYRTYSEDKSLMLLQARSQGNTVRSFFPVPADHSLLNTDRGKPLTISPISNGSPGGVERVEQRQINVFLFNLSAIPTPEALVDAEIRLDGHSKGPVSGSATNDSSATSWRLHVSVYRIQQNSCNGDGTCDDNTSKIFTKVGGTSMMASRTSVAWSASDLVQQAAAARKTGHFVVVSFEKGHVEEVQSSDNGDALLRKRRGSESNHLPDSFVVTDAGRPKRNSNSKRASALHPAQTETSSAREKSDWFDSNSNAPAIPMLILYCNDSRTAVAEDVSSPEPFLWGALGNVTASMQKRRRRFARSADSGQAESRPVDGNQFPDDVGGEEDNSSVDGLANPHLGRRLQVVEKKRGKGGSKSQKRLGSKRRNSIDNDQTELHDNGKSNRRVMEKLEDRTAARQRKRYRKCLSKEGKSKKKCKKLLKNRVKPHPSILTSLNRADAACGRRSLHVDFANIGWSDWIISPKFFDAYYCTGRCELSQMQESGTSNHAIIQAVIRAMGVNKEVPTPCCVPEKLMSLSVLFFDEDRNVVLKVYPNMSVETCSCR